MAERKLRLTITGAQEDYPRLLAASVARLPASYGGGGTFALAASEAGISASIAPKKRRGQKQADPVLLQTTGSSSGFQPSTLKEAKAAIREVKAAAPKKAGPLSLRGTWTGTAILKDSVGTKFGLHDGLRLNLKRKISSYGWLRLSWTRAGWSWTFERLATWGGERAFTSGKRLDYTLNEAIKDGLAHAMGLVAEVCQLTATHRRAALDTGYAEKHPIRLRKPARDVLARFLDQQADKRTPKTPNTQRQLDRAAQAVVDGAEELLTDLGRRIPKGAGRRSAAERALLRASPEAHAIYEDYIAAEHVSVGDVHMSVRELVVELSNVVDPNDEKANEAIKALAAHLRAQPAALDRHAALLRFAYAALSSNKCSGKAEREAQALLEEAVAAYEDAVKAHAEGKTRREFRKIRDSLKAMVSSAAKTSRSCTIGQQALGLGAGKPKGEGAAPSDTFKFKMVFRAFSQGGGHPRLSIGQQSPRKFKGVLFQDGKRARKEGSKREVVVWAEKHLKTLAAAGVVMELDLNELGVTPPKKKTKTLRAVRSIDRVGVCDSCGLGVWPGEERAHSAMGVSCPNRGWSYMAFADVPSTMKGTVRADLAGDCGAECPVNGKQWAARGGKANAAQTFACSRTKGHSGPHQAHLPPVGRQRKARMYVWNDGDSDVMSSDELHNQKQAVREAARQAAWNDKANLDRVGKLEEALHLARMTEHTQGHAMALGELKKTLKAHGGLPAKGDDTATMEVLAELQADAKAYLKRHGSKPTKPKGKPQPQSQQAKDALLLDSFKTALADVLGGL